MFLRTLPLRRFTIRTPAKRPRLLALGNNFRHVKIILTEWCSSGQKRKEGKETPKILLYIGVSEHAINYHVIG